MNLKNKLIKIGSENPDLQRHIRPVLDKISVSIRDPKRALIKIQGTVENDMDEMAEEASGTHSDGVPKFDDHNKQMSYDVRLKAYNTIDRVLSSLERDDMERALRHLEVLMDLRSFEREFPKAREKAEKVQQKLEKMENVGWKE